MNWSQKDKIRSRRKGCDNTKRGKSLKRKNLVNDFICHKDVKQN